MTQTKHILVTGCAGYLGTDLSARLLKLGHTVVGADVVAPKNPAPGLTTVQVDLADVEGIRALWERHGPFDVVFHTAALHKPMIATHSRQQFIDTNITGTLNLLENSIKQETMPVFIFTSTTSLMANREIKRGDRVHWVDETLLCMPRNIYGVTKLSAEHLCRMFHEEHNLPLLILRTSRFFPEDDDLPGEQSMENMKADELLNRRVALIDCTEAHVVAMDKAKELGFDLFIISAPTPFSRDDLPQLYEDRVACVAKYFPDFEETYKKVGWTLGKFDRVYDASRAVQLLGWRPQVTFGEVIKGLQAGQTSFL